MVKPALRQKGTSLTCHLWSLSNLPAATQVLSTLRRKSRLSLPTVDVSPSTCFWTPTVPSSWEPLSGQSAHSLPGIRHFLGPLNLIQFKPTFETEQQQQIPKLLHPVSLSSSSHSSSRPPQPHRQTFLEKLTPLAVLVFSPPTLPQSCITSSHRSLCFPTHGSPNGASQSPPHLSTAHGITEYSFPWNCLSFHLWKMSCFVPPVSFKAPIPRPSHKERCHGSGYVLSLVLSSFHYGLCVGHLTHSCDSDEHLPWTPKHSLLEEKVLWRCRCIPTSDRTCHHKDLPLDPPEMEHLPSPALLMDSFTYTPFTGERHQAQGRPSRLR